MQLAVYGILHELQDGVYLKEVTRTAIYFPKSVRMIKLQKQTSKSASGDGHSAVNFVAISNLAFIVFGEVGGFPLSGMGVKTILSIGSWYACPICTINANELLFVLGFGSATLTNSSGVRVSTNRELV